MALTSEKIKTYRRIGHRLKPVVILSENGLSEGVLNELQRALRDHELIKVKINAGDREIRQQLIELMCQQTGAELVQKIGNIALIFKAADKPNPRLSNLLR